MVGLHRPAQTVRFLETPVFCPCITTPQGRRRVPGFDTRPALEPVHRHGFSVDGSGVAVFEGLQLGQSPLVARSA